MPKTNEKDAYFFSHDCNARNDPKILALRSVYGAEGYAVYFMLIEILREQPDYKLPINKYTFNTLAMQMQVEAERLHSIIDDCCTEFADTERNSTLLINDGKSLYSPSLLRRMGKVNEVSDIRRAAAKKRWENKTSGTSDATVQAPAENANAEQMLSKEKERKEKKSICIDANKEKSEKKKVDVFSDFASDDADLLSALRDFEKMRNKIKKPMTDQAKKRLLTELGKLSSDREEQIAILHQSEDHCWSGVFALKDDAYRPAGRQPERGGMTTAEKMDALGALHQAFSGEGARR